MFDLGKAVIAQYQSGKFVEGKILAIGSTDTGRYFYKVESDGQIYEWVDGDNVFTVIESSAPIETTEEEQAGMDQARREAGTVHFGPIKRQRIQF
jgi:hypothetical protein